MIKDKDLRIGNLVDRGTVYEIRNTVARIHYNDRYSLIAYEDLKPIPLTEEILLKCGFEKIGHLFKLHLLNSLSIEYNSECNFWYFDIYMNTSRVELMYLHELQNIYQSITFKELEIKL